MGSPKQKDETGLAVKPKHGYIYVRRNKTKPHEPGRWNQKKRLEAVTTYLSTGNLALTGRLCNIPEDTLRKWKTLEWWQELTDKYYEEDNLALSSKLTKTLEKSIEAVNDRLENGEFMYDPKTGKLRRVPAKLRDVHRVCVDMIDKKMVLRKQKAPQTVSQESTDGRLLKLAEAFAAFATNKQQEEKVVNEIVEGEYSSLPEEYQEAILRKEETLPPEYQEAIERTFSGTEAVQEVQAMETTNRIQQEESKES